MKTIYFAGGCFWGVEHFFSLIKGVFDTECGYANGNIDNPTYQLVCQGDTNFRECVKVVYDSNVITLKDLLDAFFHIIDPTVENQQGHDIGTQYQTGIYTVDDDSFEVVKAYVKDISKNYVKFCVEIKQLENFYAAETMHQEYLLKNPTGYCHISRDMFDWAKNLK